MAGLYIHIPFCKQKCAYCDFPSYAGREGDAGRYFDALLREAEIWSDEFSGRVQSPAPTKSLPPLFLSKTKIQGGMSPAGDRGDFSTVFIGGGTPSLLPAGDLERLMDRLRAILPINPAEFTVEANPGAVDKEKLESFRRMGANRISFGVQAAQDRLLKRIGRIHNWADFVRSYELAREAGFQNINADMMTGLPGQAVADAEETAEKLVQLGLEHVSCYGLIVEEGTPLAQAISKEDEVSLPVDDEERDMFHAARAELEAAGIRRYEISNFARPGFECLHNLNYWHNGDWLGLGCGAASGFAGYRKENLADLDGYLSALESGAFPPAEEHSIGPEEAVFETVMLELRLAEGIDFQLFRARHGFDFLEKFGGQAERLVSGGLMQRTPRGVALTARGLDLQNSVLMEFM